MKIIPTTYRGRPVLWLLLAAVLLASQSPLDVSAMGPPSSGLNQLVVIKPGTHELGLPAVQFEPAYEDGSMVVDIPPTLHVHRFYYDGDREYQGPIISGGPTTVVANHPKTGKRMYVNVTLPQGAPIISYCGTGITYVYPDRRVKIKFGRWFVDSVAIDYYSGQGVRRRASHAVKHMVAKTKTTLSQSASMQSFADAASESKQAMKGVICAVDAGVSKVVDGTRSVIGMVPGVAPLSSLGDQVPQQAYEAQVRGLDRRFNVSPLPIARTNR